MGPNREHWELDPTDHLLHHMRVTGSTETRRVLKESGGKVCRPLAGVEDTREKDTSGLYWLYNLTPLFPTLLQAASKPPDRDGNSTALCSTLQSSAQPPQPLATAQLLSDSQRFAHRVTGPQFVPVQGDTVTAAPITAMGTAQWGGGQALHPLQPLLKSQH